MLAEYMPVLVQICLAAAMAGGILFASWLFGQKASGNYTKDRAYECGLPAEGKPHPRFSVKFYIVAMLFILFDIEVVFLIPWVLIYREFIALGLPIILPGFFFLFVLTLGLIYEFKRKGIQWER